MRAAADRAKFAEIVARALRAVWPVVRYLAVLTLEALSFMARLLADSLSWLTALFYRRQQSRYADRADAYQQRIARLQERRRARWTSWGVLPARRRLEVRAAALTLAILTIVVGRAYWSQPDELSFEPAEEHAASADDSGPASRQAPPEPEAVAAKFEELRKTATPGEWVIPEAPVLARGQLHSWDDFKVGSPVVMRESTGAWVGRGERYRMWYRGCRFSGGEYSCGVGHAESSDGVAWTKHESPVFVPIDPVERERLDTIAVVRAGDWYYLWYSVGVDWFGARRYSTLHLAVSKDGLAWEPRGAVLRSVESNSERPIQHTALYDGKLFHLWYQDKLAFEGPRQLIHVTSVDGQRWQVIGSTPLDELQAESRGEPGRLSVFDRSAGGYRAMFAPHEGRFNRGLLNALESSDGSRWRLFQSFARLERHDSVPSRALTMTPSALASADGVWVWFALKNDETGSEDIRIGYLRRGTS